ncbi:MAG: 23S rRNA (adenine(2503)-C(2))-methyltransferase RlmN [Clostridia bacterium]|nr:23S rRNA (adenine(2503)-C(2))-methyltransferase RlmN [Clostridia bacterium]
MDNRKDIRSLFLSELSGQLEALGIQKYRAGQIYSQLYKGIDDFSGMTNLSLSLRQKLGEIYYIENLTVREKSVSKIDGTTKFLFETRDGEYVESVMMRYEHGNTACISTQIGCKMGCSFCASSRLGFARNLTPGEMLSQIDMISRECNLRVSNIVLMGIGEPLDNYDNVIKFLKLVNAPEGFNIGYRHISLSTCGLCEKIYSLAEEKMPLTLSISLHAPFDDMRSEMMPINRRYDIKTLIKACKDYIEVTGRRISFEYALIGGVNDTKECAAELIRLLKGMLCHVNLIPVNKVKESGYVGSANQKEFISVLEKGGINVTVRRKMGADIEAACGQLRRKYGGQK